MDWPEGVAAKRRVLVGALVRCLTRSKVCDVVDASTIEGVLAAAAGELWREGELRLEYVWKILCQQPGLTAREVAPPLAMFKSFEQLLGGVEVRLPSALSAVPRGELGRLREEMDYSRGDFEAALSEDLIKALKADAEERAAQNTARPSSSTPVPAPAAAALPKEAPPEAKRRRRAAWAALLTVIALGTAGASIGLAVMDTPEVVPLEDVATYVKLADGKRQNGSLSARISDGRWERMSMDEQHSAVERAFEVLERKGVASMTLTDAAGKQRALALDAEGHRSIIVFPK